MVISALPFKIKAVVSPTAAWVLMSSPLSKSNRVKPAQLLGHGVEGFGKFAQKRNRLRIIALGYLLCLPGKVVEARVRIF